MKVQNPILKGFNPDPSICYVDGVYYIATSTFEWFPGVQIHKSKDLINWELATRPLSKLSQLNMRGNPSSGGIWAPCLTYSDGLFYLIYTDVKTWDNVSAFKDTHNYLVTSPNIEGPWSEPIYLNSSGFDPSLFHEDNGKKYLLNLEWDYRQSFLECFHGIVMQEFDPKTNKLIGKKKTIFKGSGLGLTEGPHIYKKDGFYYLMVAEGGTKYEHAVTVARSKTLDGEYELHPLTPMITSLNKDITLQKAGHASMCKNEKDEWHLVHLTGRPLPKTDRCVLGRETAIQEIVWKDGWPYIKDLTNTVKDYVEVDGEVTIKKKEMMYSFENFDFLKDFQTLRVPLINKMLIKDSHLRLIGQESPMSRFNQTLVARRQTDFIFEAETCIKANPTSIQHMAGMCYRYDERNLYYLFLTYDDETNNKEIVLMGLDKGVIALHREEFKLQSDYIYIKIKVNYRFGQFYISENGVDWVKFGQEVDASKISDDYADGFTGAFVGMQVVDMETHDFYADYKYFKYNEFQ